MSVMVTTETARKQTGWRVNPIIINRVKEAARRKKISTNEFVEIVLSDATKDIETDEERLSRLCYNDEFLNRYAGKWTGNDNPKIHDDIKNSENTKAVYEL